MKMKGVFIIGEQFSKRLNLLIVGDVVKNSKKEIKYLVKIPIHSNVIIFNVQKNLI